MAHWLHCIAFIHPWMILCLLLAYAYARLLFLSLYLLLIYLPYFPVIYSCYYLFRGGVWGLRDISVRLEYGWT